MQRLLFLIGRIRSQEKDLLTRAVWQRLAEADGLNSFLNILKDTSYASAALEGATFEKFEASLVAQLKTLKNDLFSVTHFSFETLLWRKYDIHNLKLLLKMKFGFKDLRRYLIDCGEVPVTLFEQFIIDNEKVALPLFWIKIIHKAREVYEKNNDSFAKLDGFLDEILYQDLLKEARKYGGEVPRFVKQQIDAANLKVWWFSKKQKEHEPKYLSGGKIAFSFFKTSAEDSLGRMTQRVFPELNYSEDEKEADLQQKIDDNLLKSMFAKRHTLYGILPVLIFFLAKETEIKNLKTYYLRFAKQYTDILKYERALYA